MSANNSNIEYASLFTGLPLRQLILTLKENLLVLLKLIILERRIIIYSHTPSTVSSFILALCSLIPGLLAFGGTQLTSAKIKTYLKSQEMHGLPLQIYNHKTCLIPLFTLDDLDYLKDLNGYTVGTTNMLIMQLPQVKADIYIDIDKGTFTYNNKNLKSISKLTTYESEFMKSLIKSIEETTKHKEINWSCLEADMDEGSEQFAGSNDYIRREFTNFFYKFMINLSVAELICGNLEPIKKEADIKANLDKLKELYDQLQSNITVNPSFDEEEKIKDIKKDDETSNTTLSVSSNTESENIPQSSLKDIYSKENDETEEKKEIKDDPKKMEMVKHTLSDYNFKFLKEWQFTINYRLWQFIHSSMLFCFSDFSSIFFFILDAPVSVTLYYENGDTYTGEVIQGKRHGNGTLAYDNNKSIYEGEWVNDKRSGKGNQITKDGKYSGEFLE